MTISLFTFTDGSIYAYSSEVLVAYLNLPVKVVYVSEKTPSKVFEEQFPPNNRFMPSIYDDETGFKINQQVAVNQYLLDLAKDHKGLLGKNRKEFYEITAWENIIDSDIVKKFSPLEYARIAGHPYEGAELKKYLDSYDKRGLQTLNAALKGRKYLVGDSFTLAEIYGGSLLFLLLFRKAPESDPTYDIIVNFFSDEFRQTYPEITRWVEEIHQTEPFKLKNAVERVTKN